MSAYTKEQVEDLIDRVNINLQEDVVYFEICDVEYHFGMSENYKNNEVVILYEDIDENNQHFFLCNVSIHKYGYKASLETQILMTPEFLEKLVF